MNERRERRAITPFVLPKIAWAIFWALVVAWTAVLITEQAEAQTWQVVPSTGAHTVVVDPSGNHHLIITSPSHGYGYGAGQQPGWSQYPNPVDSFMTNYLRAQQQMRAIRSNQ